MGFIFLVTTDFHLNLSKGISQTEIVIMGLIYYIFTSQLLLYLQKLPTNVLSSAPSFTSAIVPKASPTVRATLHTAACH